MQSGYQTTPKFAHPARKQSKDRWAATSWPASAVKTSATCAQDLGNQTTKIISNAISTKRRLIKSSTDRNRLWRE
jgi:hypothetical protein